MFNVASTKSIIISINFCFLLKFILVTFGQIEERKQCLHQSEDVVYCSLVSPAISVQLVVTVVGAEGRAKIVGSTISRISFLKSGTSWGNVICHKGFGLAF